MELIKSSKDEKVEEHILMLNDPTKKELIDFGNELFPNSSKRQLETLVGEKIEKDRIQTTIKSLSKKYKYVFTEREIYEECLEYNLKFQETSKYEEDFDYTYIEKIKKFIDDNNLLVSREELRYNFMILTKTFNNNNPLIFYKHKEAGTTYYILIEGDLTYKNLFNWFLGFLKSTEESYKGGIWMITSLILFIVASFILVFFSTYCFEGNILVFGILAVISCFSFGITDQSNGSEFAEHSANLGYKLPAKSFLINSKDFIIIGFYLFFVVGLLYLNYTLNYTLNPREVYVNDSSKVSHVELRKNYNIIPEVGKSYELVKKDLVLRTGHYLYTTDSIISQSKPQINACK